MSDQRTPAFILQLGSIVQRVVDRAITENVMNVDGLRPQASWKRIGRYVTLSKDQGGGPGAWFGVHFGLWKTHGATPFWLVFSDTTFGRAREARRLMEPWATKNDFMTVSIGDEFAIALEIPAGEEEARIAVSLTEKIKEIAKVLAWSTTVDSPTLE
jgi:hypothetical protein